MINNTTHMFSLSWWGYYFKQRDMLSPSKMITYHFQGWIQKFSGVEGVNTHFNSTHPTPKISTKIFQIKSGHSRMQFDFLRLYTFFSYVYFWIFIYFLREEENDYLQIRGFVKTCELIANVSKASLQFSTVYLSFLLIPRLSWMVWPEIHCTSRCRHVYTPTMTNTNTQILPHNLNCSRLYKTDEL